MSVQCSCAICFDDLFIGEGTGPIYTIPCGHVFHYRCITKSMKKCKVCPKCGANVKKNNLIKLNLQIDEIDVASLGYSYRIPVRRSARISETTSTPPTRSAKTNNQLKTKEREIVALKQLVNDLQKQLKDERERNAIIRSDLRIMDVINLDAESENATAIPSTEECIDFIDLS